MDNEYIFGANILENLTTGMYKDSRIIYREYIQNSCDSIDKAVNCGLFSSKKEGKILIELSVDKRTISIEDNAMGIPQAIFKETLANIADSNKRVGEDKGFRGIGRLCGLAYCKEMKFSSKALGENVVSIMHCDAKKMREMINKSENGEKVSASEVLHQIYSFEEKPDKDKNSHWFKVELIDINQENTDLMDFTLVKDYLSFVAPVPYRNVFIYRDEIYKHAEEIGQKIDEYDIRINGENIFKQYSTKFKTRIGDDDILDVKFYDIYENGELIAWLWYGVSHFKGVIEGTCKMRGLRIRKENIQIGDEDAISNLFKEERGNHYYVGELFAVSKELIPNSQRDYFNENSMRIIFEKRIKSFFKDTLYKIYYGASEVNSSYKAIDNYTQKLKDHENKEKSGQYIDAEHRDQAKMMVSDAFNKAQDAQKKIEKRKQDTDGEAASIVSQLITRMDTERMNKGQKESTEKLKKPKAETVGSSSKKIQNRTDKLSRCNNKERKLISKIYKIIADSVDDQTAEKIIQRIEDEFN